MERGADERREAPAGGCSRRLCVVTTEAAEAVDPGDAALIRATLLVVGPHPTPVRSDG